MQNSKLVAYVLQSELLKPWGVCNPFNLYGLLSQTQGLFHPVKRFPVSIVNIKLMLTVVYAYNWNKGIKLRFDLVSRVWTVLLTRIGAQALRLPHTQVKAEQQAREHEPKLHRALLVLFTEAWNIILAYWRMSHPRQVITMFLPEILPQQSTLEMLAD